ncbi:MAG: hypothetical protein JXA37_13565 [Chloroflexia bacterium]|nr:hypothetical protein [Chloroflexia bacterium]
MDPNPVRHHFFQRTVQAFSIYAVLGFFVLNALQPPELLPSLLSTLIPATVFFLALQFVLYRRTNLAWLLLRHTLANMGKVVFLLALLLPLGRHLGHMVEQGALNSLGGLLLVILGTLVGFVLFSWGWEALIDRFWGERARQEAESEVKTLDQLDQLPLWRLMLLWIPRFKRPRQEKAS